MDMRIIEVAIGLVLVFALASLLITTLHELWTSLWGRRGNTLLLAVSSVLGDNDVTTGSMRRRMFESHNPSPFTQAVMAHPLMVSQKLGEAGEGKLPSYVPSDVFVNSLLAQLSALHTDDARLATPREWVNAVTAGVETKRQAGSTEQPEPALVAVLRTLAHGVANDWPTYELRLRAWYDSVMARSIGWYRRDTQLRLFILGTLVAAAVNINPLVIAPRLWADPALRALTARMAEQAVEAYAQASSPSASAPQAPASAASAPRQPAPAARTATPAAAPASAVQPVRQRALPHVLESDQALSALKEALLADAGKAGEAGKSAQAALNRTLDLQDQVRLRRETATATATATANPAAGGLFDASVIIENHLQALQAKSPAAAEALVPRLVLALQLERDAVLPPDARPHSRRGADPVAVAQICVGTVDEALLKLCEPLGAVQSLADAGMPLGWRWANWPDCDGACQARRRGAPDPALADAHDDAYATALRSTRTGCAAAPQSCSAAATGAATGTDRAGVPDGAMSAHELRTLYDAAQRSIARALAASDAPHDRYSPSWWQDARAGLFYAFVGWFIVGFASCLGSPFWFDMLGRFVKLRGSGTPAGTAEGALEQGSAQGPTTADTMTRGPTSTPTGGGTEGAGPPQDTGALNPAERALDSPRIVRLQGVLGLQGVDASGRFDGPTRAAILQWQQDRREAAPNGELSASQIGVLLAPTAMPAAPAGAAVARSATPVRADGTVNVLREDEVRALYGDIATEPAAGGLVKITRHGVPNMPQHVMVDFTHPLLQPLVGTLKVHERALPHFKEVFNRIDAAGLGHLIVSCGGTYVPRHIGRETHRPLSRHTWGIAIDLNTAQNAMGATPPAQGQHGSVVALVRIFNDCGFAWGGHFSSGPDGMHFELALRAP
jgi:hypothetical protein